MHVHDLKYRSEQPLADQLHHDEFDAEDAAELSVMLAVLGVLVGWLAWSWKGNGGATRVLDMSQDYGKVTLTRRGEEIVKAWGGPQKAR